MARAISFWLPSLTVVALSACGGSESGFFSNVVSSGAGAGGASHAGASSNAGSFSIAGSLGVAGSAPNPTAGSAGRVEAGGGSGGAHSAGAGGTSTGGATNSGGTTGSAAGAGGNVAGAGAKNGGAVGVGGSIEGLTCSELFDLADDQLAAARECNLAANATQCTGKVMNTCNCQVPVQRSDSAETKAYQKTFKLIQDKDCAQFCPALVCPQVNDAECEKTSGSSAGVCIASHGGPTP